MFNYSFSFCNYCAYTRQASVRIPGAFALCQVVLLKVQYFKVVQLFIELARQIALKNTKWAET